MLPINNLNCYIFAHLLTKSTSFMQPAPLSQLADPIRWTLRSTVDDTKQHSKHICKDFSHLTMNSSATLQQLPSELLSHIFTFLLVRDLKQVMAVCKHFHAVANVPMVWKQLYARTYRVAFSSLEKPNVDDWKRAFQQQKAMNSHLFTNRYKYDKIFVDKTPCNTSALLDDPHPSAVFIDLSQHLYLISESDVVRRDLRTEEWRSFGTISWKHACYYDKVSFSICTIHEAGVAILCVHARQRHHKKADTKLLGYLPETNSILWETSFGERYLFAGGTDMGIGALPSKEASRWKRRLSQARCLQNQHLSSEVIFSTRQAAFDALHNRHTICARQIYSGALLAEVTIDLPKNEMPVHCDANVDGTIALIASADPDISASHHLLVQTDDKTFTVDSTWQVLAFDRKESQLIAKSLKFSEASHPLFIIKKMTTKHGFTVVKTALALPSAKEYLAQINHSRACIFSVFEARYRECYLVDLNHVTEAVRSIDISFFNKATISTFSLLNDSVIFVVKNASTADTQLVKYDVQTGKLVDIVITKPFQVLGREDDFLICRFEDRYVKAIDLKTNAMHDLFEHVGDISYRSFIFTYLENNTGSSKLQAFTYMNYYRNSVLGNCTIL